MTTKNSRIISVPRTAAGPIEIGSGKPLAFFCGPCVIESRAMILDAAKRLQDIFGGLNLPLIFKSSYDKANRTALSSFRGVGLAEGLDILAEVRESLGLPVITDVHSAEDAVRVGKVADVLQVPAFLCRQTDILIAAGNSKKPVMVKKGQMLAPEDMQFAVEKIESSGNKQVLLCERGVCFGYRTLVVDFRALETMAQTGCPVVFDATHSVQSMGGGGGKSSGTRESIPLLARAAVAAGVNAVFIEAHENPAAAPSDGPNMLSFTELPVLLRDLKALHQLKLETR